MEDFTATQEDSSPTSAPRLHVKATAEQICHLQAAFLTDAHPTAETKQRLADLTGLSVRWITAWFSRKRRSSGLGTTPPAAQRTGSSRTERGPPFHERLIIKNHPQPAGLDMTALSPASHFPLSGWPGPQLSGPGTPGIPPRPRPPPLNTQDTFLGYGIDTSTPSLSSAFSTTSSPFPLTPFSVYDTPVDGVFDVGQGYMNGYAPSSQIERSPKDSKLSSSDIDHSGISPATLIDWEFILSSDDSPTSSRRSGTIRRSAPSSHALSNIPPGLIMPITYPSHVKSDTIPSSSRLPSIPAAPTPISYPVRLSEIRAAHRLAYVNYLNAQSTSKILPATALDPLLSSSSNSSPSSGPLRIPTPVKRPASGSSLCSEVQKKPRLSTDDKENWPPISSSPSPAIL